MAIFHCSVKVISRSSGRSAVAAAAYRAGEELHDYETGIKHDYTRKGGVDLCEIILPANAPEKYLDRQTLWNEVQQVEKRSDARLAREVEVALPVEMSHDEQIECVRNYIRENFTEKGMIADWALHDKSDGNPHAHIMLTVRGFNQEHEWDTKTKSVFANDRDEQGRAIYNPEKPSYNPKDRQNTEQYRIPQLDQNGEQKFRDRPGKGREYMWERVNIPSNDWNDRANVEKWRESWEINCNRYLEQEQKIDHRSYERQGIDKEPTIHEGYTARKIELEGNISDRMQINREITERNSIREQLMEIAKEISLAVIEKARAIYERFTRLAGDSRDPEQTRRDAGHTRTAADRDRADDDRESELERTSGRIVEIERDTKRTDKDLQDSIRKIERASRDIEETNRRIREFVEVTARKEHERNERIEKLRARRAADYDGRDAGRDRDTEIGEQTVKTERDELRSTTEDIESFIAGIDAQEQGARAIADDSKSSARNSELERKDRDAEQERLAAEAERDAREESRRDRGFSR